MLTVEMLIVRHEAIRVVKSRHKRLINSSPVSMLVQCPKNKKKGWLFLVDAMPKLWVEALNKDLELSVNLAIYDHNLIKNCQLYALDRLVSKELYNISLCSVYEKTAAQNYFKLL